MNLKNILAVSILSLSVFGSLCGTLKSEHKIDCQDKEIVSRVNKTKIGYEDDYTNPGQVPSYTPVNFGNYPDRSAFFIKNVKLNKSMDVRMADYSEGVKIILYNQSGFENQRFIIGKEYNNDATQYSIFPLGNDSLCARMASSSSSERLSLSKPIYTDTQSMSLSKYKFIEVGNGNYYIYNVGTDEILGPSSYNTSNSSADIISKSMSSLSSSELEYYEWSFSYCDSLVLNSYRLQTLSSNNNAYYNINAPYTSNYVIRAKNSSNIYDYSNIQIKIFKAGTNELLMTSTANSLEQCQELTINLSPDVDYYVKVYNVGGATKNIKTSFLPSYGNSIFQYGLYDELQNRADRVTPMTTYNSDYISNSIVPMVYANNPKSLFLPNTEADYSPFRSKYFVWRSHGSTGYVYPYNGRSSSNQGISVNSLPSMNGNNASFWLTCDSAANYTSSSYTTNFPRESVVKGAQYSVGFKQAVNTVVTNTLTKHIMYYLSSGNNFSPELLLNAISLTAMDEYVLGTLYQNEQAYRPSLYTRDSQGNIKLYQYNGVNGYTSKPYSIYDDDCAGTRSSFSSNNIVTANNESSRTTFSEDTGFDIRLSSDGNQMLVINGINTNLVNNESNRIKLSSFISENENLINSYRLQLTNGNNLGDFIFSIDNELHYFAISYDIESPENSTILTTLDAEITFCDILEISKSEIV